MNQTADSSSVEHLLMLQYDLETSLDASIETTEQKHKNLIWNYLKGLPKYYVQDEFKDLKWFNVSKPLSLKDDLNGLIVLCDFFTYCCVNCLHILPYLRKFEEEYSSKETLVLGIHSPKFNNEKSLQNVANAILRHEIIHPVCNDPELKLWNKLTIFCWPTIAIIGPNGELLFILIGELDIQTKLERYVNACLEYFGQKQELNLQKKVSLPIQLLKNSQKFGQNYPTKISLSNDQEKLAIAETLAHVIIVTAISGLVEFKIGNTNNSGFKDGSFEEAIFNYPQGITWIDYNVFYVCDTENNAIRKVDLVSKTVSTVVKSLNSPWDIIFNPIDQTCYIAMAGSHQIWTLTLSKSGESSCVCFAGDGNEQKHDHRFLLKSSFAQPSGLAFDAKYEKLYVADSESSSIRMIDMNAKSVYTMVGGDPNPLNLFAFGDQDGIGYKCKLQHCMGICTGNDNNLYIADTFNHKIKKLNTETKECKTISFHWKDEDSSNEIEKSLNEPNGLCFLQEKNILLIADTNNHRIISLNLEQNEACQFPLLDSSLPKETFDLTDGNEQQQDNKCINLVENPFELYIDQEVTIHFNFLYGNHFKVPDDAPQKMSATISDDNNLHISIIPQSMTVKSLNDVKFVIKCSSTTSNKQETIEAEAKFIFEINLCNFKENYCHFQRIQLRQPILIIQSAINNNTKHIDKFVDVNICSAR